MPTLVKTARQHSAEFVRLEALRALRCIDEAGDTAVDALVRELHRRIDRDVLAELSMAAPESEPAVEVLLQTLKDAKTREDQFLYAHVTYALAAVGPPVTDAIPILKSDMTEYQYELRETAAYYLSLDERREISDRHTALIRICAAGALARIDPVDDSAITFLIDAVEDTRWQGFKTNHGKMGAFLHPRCEAARNLGFIGERGMRALPTLKGAIQHSPANSACLSSQAGWAVARIDPTNVSCFMSLPLGVGQESWESPFYCQSPEEVSEVIGDRFDTFAQRFLEEPFTYDDFYRRYWLDLLLRTGHTKTVGNLVSEAFRIIPELDGVGSLVLSDTGPRAAPALVEIVGFLDSDHHLIRAEAARMLGIITEKADICVPALTEKLNDPRALVRARVAQALGKFGSRARPALDQLSAATRDPYESVQVAATTAMKKIRE